MRMIILALGILGLSMSMMTVSITPAGALSIRHPGCKAAYRKWQRLAGYKAFAVTANGRACGWSYAYVNRGVAHGKALEWCRKQAGGARCYIYDAR